MKIQMKNLKPGQIFVDSLGLRLRVVEVDIIPRIVNDRVRLVMRREYGPQCDRPLLIRQTFPAEREVELAERAGAK